MENKLVKILLIVLAAIGLFAVIGFVGMAIMMGGMMGR